jgi:predicted amino acid dehydrogenase
LFWGGMGVLAGGLRSDDGILERFYDFPAAHVAHGCMLEGAVLAIAGRFESFSVGRGRITLDRIDEMWSLATACGVSPAPLFGAGGLWPEEVAA